MITRFREFKMGMEKTNMQELARWAYILFVVIAILAGLVVGYMAYGATGHWLDAGVADANSWVVLIMLILGIIIGVTSIAAKEVTPFLIATIALIVAAAANVWLPLMRIHELLYDWAYAILNYIVAFAAPAAVIIAIKSVFAMSKEK
jgi:F0F1-type ATP synthase assembly protein I